MTEYLAFGLGFYIGLALKNPEGFIKADAASLVRGLIIGILIWPIGVIVETVWAIQRLNEKD